MSIRTRRLWLAVWLIVLCGSSRVDAQYRLVSREEPAGHDLVRLPSPTNSYQGNRFSSIRMAQTDSQEVVGDVLQDGATSDPSALGGAGDTPADSGSVEIDSYEQVPGESGLTTSNDFFNWNPGEVDYVSPYMRQSGPLHGFFFQYDRLLWNITNPDVSVIGDPAAEGFVTVDGVPFFHSNDLDTNILNGRVNSANRFEFGHSEGDRGWFASIILGDAVRDILAEGVNFVPTDGQGLLQGYFDGNGDGFDDDLDGDGTYGRFGIDTNADGFPDTGAPVDPDDLVNFLVTFDELRVRDIVDISGVELNRAIRRSPNWELFYGIRYLDFRNYFSLTGESETMGGTTLATSAKNQIIGPQIGFRYRGAAYKFILNVEGRFVPGYNHQQVQQTGDIGDGLTGAPGEPAALLPTHTMSSSNADEFSPIGEIRAEAILPINHFLAFRFGYTGTVIGGLSYASTKVVYSLPNFGITDIDRHEAVFVNAFNVGIVINR